jgi:DNA adenine methylase
MTAQPFVKFVGGKTQLVPTLLKHLPPKMRCYYEPFVGGGALFFSLASHTDKRYETAVLGDTNDDLINAYRAVRDCPARLSELLCEYEARYELAEKETFYAVRALDRTTLSHLEQAARFIFLNKTCFNGMFRVNRRGEFNVPWCRKFGRVSTHAPSNLLACSKALDYAATSVYNCDFDNLLMATFSVRPGDAVYFDPPYHPTSKTANFTEYVPSGFRMNEQKRLAHCAEDCVNCGAFVMISNSDVPEIVELYVSRGFEIHRVNEKRNINSKGDRRGAVGTILAIGRPS